jgi:hypothetical protein
MNQDRLTDSLPPIHGDTTFALLGAVIEWFDTLPRPLQTLETGCGLSTIAFIARGDEHICITPNAEEARRVRNYCQSHNIDITSCTFRLEPSEFVLPRLDVSLRDLILIDGSHSFPQVFIDFFYSAQLLKVGGILVVDDVHLWTGKVLRDFLSAEPDWERVEEWDGRTIAFRKERAIESRVWFDQPYVRSRSAPSRARMRMVISMVKNRDFATLANYVRQVLSPSQSQR